MFLNPVEYGRKAEEVLWRKVFYQIIQMLKHNKRLKVSMCQELGGGGVGGQLSHEITQSLRDKKLKATPKRSRRVKEPSDHQMFKHILVFKHSAKFRFARASGSSGAGEDGFHFWFADQTQMCGHCYCHFLLEVSQRGVVYV